MTAKTTAQEIASTLVHLIAELADLRDGERVPVDELDPDAHLHRCSVATYEDEAVLTTEHGLVLKLLDGSEFQITIVRSR